MSLLEVSAVNNGIDGMGQYWDRQYGLIVISAHAV